MGFCEQLTSTYNSNYLTHATDLEKKIIRKIVRDYRNTGLGNQTLMNLLYNRERGLKPVTPFISGPFSLSLQTNKHMGMTVYTFGESHGDENMCHPQEMAITDYLSNLILTTDAFIDLFIEMHPITNKTYAMQWDNAEPKISKSNKSLYELHKKFAPCMTDQKREECSLSRVHWVDARELEFFTMSISHFRTWVCRYGELTEKDIEDITPMVELFARGDREEIKDFFQEQIDLVSSLLKTNSYMKNQILAFCKRSISEYAIYVERDIIYYSKKLSENIRFSEDFEKSMKGLCEALTPPTSVVADFYTLSRMFKDFQNVEGQPLRPMNIIFYGGNAHSKVIRRFLYEQSFETLNYNNNGDQTRCLDMTGFPQPFFNAMP